MLCYPFSKYLCKYYIFYHFALSTCRAGVIGRAISWVLGSLRIRYHFPAFSFRDREVCDSFSPSNFRRQYLGNGLSDLLIIFGAPFMYIKISSSSFKHRQDISNNFKLEIHHIPLVAVSQLLSPGSPHRYTLLD